ncbi:MAG: HAMP domain-containing sensor histidine kinase, partial [Mucilaginibacter sp.]
ELENLNHELQALNLSKDKFLSVISHDLRNPLTSLLASAQNLDQDVEKLRPDQIKFLAGIINRTSQKILSQLNELVDWAKNQRDKTSFRPEKLHLSQGINESLELLKANAAHKEITLENNTGDDIYIQADALMFRSIMQNLVTNAIKFTPLGGGAVTVSAQQADGMTEICIQDLGVGMSKETKDKLFGPINTDSLLGTNHEKGTGLGLILVKDFVIQHGGRIHVESEMGKGTCFRFTMPVAN